MRPPFVPFPFFLFSSSSSLAPFLCFFFHTLRTAPFSTFAKITRALPALLDPLIYFLLNRLDEFVRTCPLRVKTPFNETMAQPIRWIVGKVERNAPLIDRGNRGACRHVATVGRFNEDSRGKSTNACA